MMNLKYFLLFIITLIFTSCVSIVRGVFGNKIMESNYNPLQQEQIYFVETPYTIEDGFVVIKVRINNSKKQYSFIFDTGADTVVSEDLLTELNILNAEKSVALDAHGQLSSGATFRTNLSIDSLLINGIRVSSTKSKLFNQNCNDKFDGIIGWNILKQGYFYFNPSTKILTITNDRDKIQSQMFQNSLHLKLKMGNPYVKIKGRRSLWVLFDTGYANGYVNTYTNSGLLEKNAKLIKSKKQITASLNSSKLLDIDYFKQNVKFGNFYKSQSIAVSDLKINSLGNKILQENHVIIDVTNNKLFITPIDAKNKEREISNIGFSYNEENVIVASIVDKSIFGIAGIKINDTIIKLNEYTMSDLKNYCEYNDLFNKLKFPLIMVFKNRDQQIEITATREEYYE